MKSELSLKEEIDLYISSNLTPTELFIIRLLFLAQDGDSTHLMNYLSNVTDGKELFRAVLASLQKKSIILASFKIPEEGQSIRFKDIPFNKNFLKRYIKESNQLGKEFFEAYPSFMFIGEKMASIKNITKAGLFSLDEFCIHYTKQIKAACTTHERIMKSLEFGKEHNLIRYTMLEFIASRKWEELDQIENSGDIAGYDNTELL